jgi:hypothetical protein
MGPALQFVPFHTTPPFPFAAPAHSHHPTPGVEMPPQSFTPPPWVLGLNPPLNPTPPPMMWMPLTTTSYHLLLPSRPSPGPCINLWGPLATTAPPPLSHSPPLSRWARAATVFHCHRTASPPLLVCSVLQNSPVLLGGCRVLSYISGRGFLWEDPPRWDGIIKVWMFWSLDMGPPCVTASGETLHYIPNVRYPKHPDRVTVKKGKYGSLVGKWWKTVLSRPRIWARLGRQVSVRNKELKHDWV